MFETIVSVYLSCGYVYPNLIFKPKALDVEGKTICTSHFHAFLGLKSRNKVVACVSDAISISRKIV